MCLNLGCEIYHQETFWWLSQVPPYKYESILKTDYDHFFPTFLNSSLAKANNTHTALCNLCKCHCVSKERNWLWVSLIKWLTLWCRIILEKLIVTQLVMKFKHSWLCSQPHPWPFDCSLHFRTLFKRSMLILSSHLYLGLWSGLFP